MGVVHNVEYFRWFEEGRLQVMLEVLSLEEALRIHVAMPVVENTCSYRRAVRFGDPLVLTTLHQVAPTYQGRLVFEHSLVHEKTKVEVASGRTVATLVHMPSLDLVREWPDEVWARYQALR